METIEEVRIFLRNKEIAYRQLLETINCASHEVKNELGPSIVRSIYGREDKQATGIFKSPEKIVLALEALRLTQPKARPEAISDIVGLTVVVHYPDEIAVAAECLKRRLNKLDMRKDEFLTRSGYHAHHLVFRGRQVPVVGLQCEVQIKTMLHDAWGTKTHDLTYKPRGYMDRRLSRLMQVFGDALQAIEVQSELLRDLIRERWEADAGPREIVRLMLFESIQSGRRQERFGSEGDAIRAAISSRREELANAASDDKELSDVVTQINDLGGISIRDATWLAIQLAMIRENAEFITFANEKATDLVIGASALLANGELDHEEIANLPLAVAAYGDNVKAVWLSRHLAEKCTTLNSLQRQVLLFNLANLLVECALDGPPLSSLERSQLCSEVDELVAQCPQLRQRDESVFLDLEGLKIVATSIDPVEIRRGIDLLQQGCEKAPEPDKPYAKACFELNARIAWRRLLELEREMNQLGHLRVIRPVG